MDTDRRSRLLPRADSSSDARYSILATTPARNPNWCPPTSRRPGPVAFGSVETEPKVLISAGSRNTIAPIGGPPHPTALTATTSASVSLMSISRYGAAAEWSRTTRPPTSCTSLVIARRSVTAPNVPDADVTATSRVDLLIKLSHCHVGNSPVSISTSAHLTLAPYRWAARSHGAML